MIASAVIPFGIKKVSDCDILLCHSQPSMWLGYRVNALFGTPYVGYLHQLTTFIHKRPEVAGNWNTKDFLLLDGLLGKFGKRLVRQFDRLCHLRAAKLLFNSDWTRSLFQKTYGVAGDICYPAIDTQLKSCSADRKNQVVIAARHYPWKRIDMAFSVLKELRTKMPHLFVTGKETSHTRFLKERAAKVGMSDHVTFTGYVDDSELVRLYAESKAYVQTSICEPFGLSPLEAQSHGTPAVVWGDAGVRETVLDGVSGFHAIPYSLTDYASKLDMILSDNERWREMSRGALIWSSSFTWDSHIDLLEGTLDEERR